MNGEHRQVKPRALTLQDNMNGISKGSQDPAGNRLGNGLNGNTKSSGTDATSSPPPDNDSMGTSAWPDIPADEEIITRDLGLNDHVEANSTASSGWHSTNGTHKKELQPAESPDQGLGILVEHTHDDTTNTGRSSVVDVLEGQKITAALAELTGDGSSQSAEGKEKVIKLSPAKIQELTSSPDSIPYRVATPDTKPGRRGVSDYDNINAVISRSEVPDIEQAPISARTAVTDSVLEARPGKDVPFEEASVPASPLSARQTIPPSARNRPHPSRTFSTPASLRRTLPVSPNNERLAQTWASRPKQDRPTTKHMDRESKGHLGPSPQINETPLSSPLPPYPLPPVSIPTYLQLELASGRPSPLYIHRSATSDFPYESAHVKLERLMNFLRLPFELEQVLWFGALACLDSWLHTFTILPLRFVKAVYILAESWVMNLDAEIRFIWNFVLNGVGRVWQRKIQSSTDDAGERRGSEPDAAPRLASSSSVAPESTSVDRESKHRHGDSSRRRHRTSEVRKHHHHHRRRKSMPSALLPDDKADILTGLLMIATCCVLMYLDASRMYHWIRGQAAIKLYVIYNVLEVSDRLLAAIGQDVLESLFSREALERRPDGRSKIFRPFGLFLLSLVYTVTHATSLFYQAMTLNVAVNAYSNALITLLMSNQFVEIKSTVFRKFEKENLFQLTCADVVERFQLWLMLTIIASRNIVETGAFNFVGDLGLGSSISSQSSSTATNSTPLSTPPRTASSIIPQSFTFFPSSILTSLSNANSFLPTLAQVLGPVMVVLGSEMLVDWLKHAYINKFNNTRPAIYGRFLDLLAKDYYTNAFGDHNLTRRLGLPVIPLSCLFVRVSVQTYQMFLASLLPQHPSSTVMDSASLSSIHDHYSPVPIPSGPPLSLRTLLPASAAHFNTFVRTVLANLIPTPAQSVQIFTVILVLTGFVVLLILKLLLGMVLLAFARSRYRKMNLSENEAPPSHSSSHPQTATGSSAPRHREFAVEGSRRVGGWGMVEVGDERRRWIYADDPDGLQRLKEKEERDKNKDGDMNIDHVQRYEMVAKKIW
ncbi:hypothetical protein N7510_005671 [Penicillium lagena]|uniref:uncharacterized protein n=1 Tax=Penicillium lagena TaxID=94218 RepID=UPI002540F5EB|nr:uncharacterized protein N7510_005671 [Penicillium lagena]KAJ5612477.1 hypothetical protein N7510_005671 [Penicillium lagena]